MAAVEDMEPAGVDVVAEQEAAQGDSAEERVGEKSYRAPAPPESPSTLVGGSCGALSCGPAQPESPSRYPTCLPRVPPPLKEDGLK